MDPLKNRRLEEARTQRASGFTLIEVMIAMAILAFGLLGLAVLQIHALQQSAAGRHTTQASHVARTFLEQTHRLPWSALGSAVNTWTDPGWGGATSSVSTQIATPDGGLSSEKTYDIAWRVSEVGAAGCLREVEVRVRWPEAKVTSLKESILATRRYNWGAAGC